MAKALKWQADFSEFNKKIQKLPIAVDDGASSGMEYSGKAAANEMRRLIGIRGSFGSSKRYAGEYLAAGFGPGNSAGRDNTGAMINSVDFNIINGKNGFRLQVGYLNGAEKYFKAQEYGFDNHGIWIPQYVNKKGETHGGYFINAPYPVRWTEGIFALRDSLSLFEKVSPGLIAAQISNNLKVKGLV